VRRGWSTATAARVGLVGALVLLGIAYGAFTKRVPFVEGYRVEAVFESSNGLRGGSPVRIAGVDVGKVFDVREGPGATSVVVLELGDRGRPVKRDAIARIRPRLFLEGGFYVELEPGSPSAPELDDGGTIPLTQTKLPVQFDEILTVFDGPVRDGLRSVIRELDTAMDGGGAEGAAAAARPLAPLLRDGAIVADAAQGTRDDDLSRLVGGAARVTSALAERRADLAGLVRGLATTAGALGDEAGGLAGTVREADRLLGVAPVTLPRIAARVPAAERLLAEARPGLRRARTALPAVNGLLAELRRASRPRELPALLAGLRPAVGDLPRLTDRLSALFPLVTPVTDCVRDNALPVLEAKVDDGPLSTGKPVWQELASALATLPGASGPFDANGPWIRYAAGGGDQTLSTGQVPGIGTLLASSDQVPQGVRPTPLPPRTLPEFRPDAPCQEQAPVDVQARTSGTSPGLTATPRRRVAPARVTRGGLRRMLAPKALERALGDLPLPGARR
jgi:phospholipid/cholesterol/gamma-HCH transport system substrate-binding protein